MKKLLKEITKITLKPNELLLVKIIGDVSYSTLDSIRKQLEATFDQVFGPGAGRQMLIMFMPHNEVEFIKVTRKTAKKR